MKKSQPFEAARFAELLCEWQKLKGRKNLPWFTDDPYRRWLSEIMLQQTQVSVVKDYFARFLEAFPTVEDLACADEEDVMRLWAGLGYYSRARNLHRAAKLVVQAGGFPISREEWEMLPGVGTSTAAALASFCSSEPAAVCDGNVKRVLARILALNEPVDQAKTGKFLQQEADRLVSRIEPGVYNQAMMDLGAMLCTKHAPKCPECPVTEYCRAYAAGNPEDYPRKLPKKPKRTALVHALLAVEGKGADRRVWLVKRTLLQKGMGHWKGLWTLPEVPESSERELARIEHVMSHVALTLVVHAAKPEQMPPDAFTVPAVDIAEAPLPAPVRKLLSTLLFEPQLF